jgi:hypothetical protein
MWKKITASVMFSEPVFFLHRHGYLGVFVNTQPEKNIGVNVAQSYTLRIYRMKRLFVNITCNFFCINSAERSQAN